MTELALATALLLYAQPAPPAPVGTATTLRLSAQPDTVFVGQQFILSAIATFAGSAVLRQGRPASFEGPATSGFWLQELPDPVTVTVRVRDGRSIETHTYRRAYFPLYDGVIRIPPAYLHYELRRGFLQPPESRRVASEPIYIVVRPLPVQGRPPSFAGAVGTFTIDARVTPDRVAVGETALLTVEVHGSGNVRVLPAPTLPAIDGLERVAATHEADVRIEDDVIGGTRRFHWMVVPQRYGTYVIPPIEYSYFDPELHNYTTRRTDPLILHALPVADTEPADTTVRPLWHSPGAEPAAWARTGSFAALQLLPLLLAGAAGMARRRRDRTPGHAEPVRRIADVDRNALRHRVRHFIAELEPRSRWPRRAAAAAAIVAIVAIAAAMASGTLRGNNEAAAAFDAALDRYATGDMAAAAAAFHDYARLRPADPAGWYNLGVAAFEAGDRGRAVWAWLRAARTAPRNADIRHNLARAAPAGTAAVVTPPDRLAPGERAALAAAGWWLACLGAAAAILARRPRIAWIGAPGALLLASLAISAGAARAAPTIVTPLGPGTTAYAGPSIHEDPMAQLPAGTAARLLERHNGWLLVRLEDGRAAWVERARVAAP